MFLNQREEPLATMEINAGVKTLARSSSGRLRRGSFVCTPPAPIPPSPPPSQPPSAPSWSCVCTTASFWPCRSLGNPRHTLHTIHTTHYALYRGWLASTKKNKKKKISLIKKKKKCCFCIFPVFLDLTAGPNFKCRKSKTSC